MDKIRFKECINYPLYYSKNPDHLSKPLKAWEKVVGTLAFVALTLLAGSFFYIKNLRIKATKNPTDPLTSKVATTYSNFRPQAAGSHAAKAADETLTKNPANGIVNLLVAALEQANLNSAQLVETLKNLSQEDQQVLTDFTQSVSSSFETFFKDFTPPVKDYFYIKETVPKKSYEVTLFGKLNQHSDGTDNGFSFTSLGVEHHFKTLDSNQILDILQSLIFLKGKEKSIPLSVRKEIRGNVLGLHLEVNPITDVTTPSMTKPLVPVSNPPQPQDSTHKTPDTFKQPQSLPHATPLSSQPSKVDFLNYLNHNAMVPENKVNFTEQINLCTASDLKALRRVLSLFDQNLKDYLRDKKTVDNETFRILYVPNTYVEESFDSHHFMFFKGQRVINNSGMDSKKNVHESFYIQNERLELEVLSNDCIKEILRGYAAANYPIQLSQYGVRPFDEFPNAVAFRFGIKSPLS